MSHPIGLILPFITAVVIITQSEAATSFTVFSAEQPAIPTVSTAGSLVPGKSKIDCAVRCAVVDYFDCAATVYLPESNSCLQSVLKQAEFGSVPPDTVVFRRETDEPISQRIIQSRSNGSLSFQRTWSEYEEGFGDGIDFWIGLRSINKLSNNLTPRTLRMEAVKWSGALYVAEYSGFVVGDASINYLMDYGSYLADRSNTSADSLAHHKGRVFSTTDRDFTSMSCSNSSGGYGGWWFNGCSQCNPNGVYFSTRQATPGKYFWASVDGMYSLKSIRLVLLP
uniref:Fibrinogen C-terminal domain-containing protein n=2 Tax=Macrostomum lignano TaxID=282301 RepID=A0A1I8I5Q4_9PLAT